MLLDKWSDVNAQDNNGYTALIRAIKGGFKNIVQLLLHKGADVNVKSGGTTALMEASYNGFKEVVQLLIDNGAEVNSTALMGASQNGHKDVVQLLIDNGAEVNAKDCGITALMYASGNGHKDVVQILIENGADVNVKDTFDGETASKTALMFALERGHENIVQLLLENGAEVMTPPSEIRNQLALIDGFDEDTYQKAKPYFEEGVRQFSEAGKGLKEFIKFIVHNLGSGVKPYFMKWVEDFKEDIDNIKISENVLENPQTTKETKMARINPQTKEVMTLLGIFQSDLDELKDGATLQLSPREFSGPVIINKRLTLDGQGATIWALRGPVVSIQSDGVVLRNIRIEVTGENRTGRYDDNCALLIEPGRSIRFEKDVEVRGTVSGLPQEEGNWQYPHSVDIGHLACGVDYDFIMRIAVPVPCQIASHISGMDITPGKLSTGFNEVHIHIERLPQDTLLHGYLSLSTTFLKRRITVTAHSLSRQSTQNPSVPVSGFVIWEPGN